MAKKNKTQKAKNRLHSTSQFHWGVVKALGVALCLRTWPPARARLFATTPRPIREAITHAIGLWGFRCNP